MAHRQAIELIQIYENIEGSRTYRFAIAGGTRLGDHIVDAVSVKAMGHAVAIQAVLLERNASDYRPETAIISVSMSRDIRCFKIAIQGIGSRHVSFFAIRKMIKARDATMVNPGIDERYHAWIAEDELAMDHPSPDDIALLSHKPLFSVIVPAFNTPEPYLRAMIGSMLAQTYRDWELVLVNASPTNESMQQTIRELTDPRIKVVELDKNKGIADNTNAGIAASRGDYICFLDHDDLLSPHALAEYATAISQDPSIDLLYCDEDSISADGTKRFSPRFKPDLNIDLLASHNYVCHFLSVSRRILDAIEPYNDRVDGAQDYDLTFKAIDAGGKSKHIPKILYHWRNHEGSTNGGIIEAKPYIEAASMLVIEDHFRRKGISCTVSPTAIPCVFEATLSPQTDKVVSLPMPASIARDGMEYAEHINSQLSRTTTGSALILDSSLAATTDELAPLLNWLQRSDVGIVAPKLFYRDGLIQHAGVCIREDGTLGHLNQGFTGSMGGGYNGTAEATCDHSAVDPACLAFRLEDFHRVGGLATDYNTPIAAVADLCFRIRALGKNILVDPQTCATIEAPVFWPNRIPSWERAESADIKLLWKRWGAPFRQDVLSNPNVSLANSYFQLRL